MTDTATNKEFNLDSKMCMLVQLSQVEQAVAAAGETEELQKLVTDLKELISLTEGIVIMSSLSFAYPCYKPVLKVKIK